MATSRPRIDGATYAAIWRWHGYAGWFVAPLLLVLAVTGAIYLFNDELNDAIYPQLRFVAPAAQTVAPHRLLTAVRQKYPHATITRLDFPHAADRSVTVFVTPNSGAPRRVFVTRTTGTCWARSSTLIHWSASPTPCTAR